MNTEKVWTLSIDTRYGVGVTLWHKEEDALEVLHDFVAENWERYFGDPDDPDTPNEDKIPEDKQEAIDAYFEHVDEDSYELELLTIN